MLNKVCFVTFILSLSVSSAFADGQAVYGQQCVVCHGAQGQGIEALSSPPLAGQSSAYLQRQLTHFKTGVRGKVAGDSTGAQMAAIAAGVDTAAIVAVSDYLSALPSVGLSTDVVAGGSTGDSGDARSGEKLYQSYCGSCHGSDASGNEMLHSPNLRLLGSAYFSAQYQKFLNGERGADRSDKFGTQMKMMAAAMPAPQQIADVAAYLQSLQAND